MGAPLPTDNAKPKPLLTTMKSNGLNSGIKYTFYPFGYCSIFKYLLVVVWPHRVELM